MTLEKLKELEQVFNDARNEYLEGLKDELNERREQYTAYCELHGNSNIYSKTIYELLDIAESSLLNLVDTYSIVKSVANRYSFEYYEKRFKEAVDTADVLLESK